MNRFLPAILGAAILAVPGIVLGVAFMHPDAAATAPGKPNAVTRYIDDPVSPMVQACAPDASGTVWCDKPVDASDAPYPRRLGP